jgi:hypothetical protein
LPQWFERLLEVFPDDIDLGIVGDGLQCDVWNTFIDKPLPDIAVSCSFGRCSSSDFSFFKLSVAAIGQEVIGIPRAHDTCASQRESNARGVDSDPAPPPLLRDIRGCAGPARRIEHEIAGIGRHENATFDDFGAGLNNVYLFVGEVSGSRVCPRIGAERYREIV